MSNNKRRATTDHQASFVRQCNILRKNIYEWDQMLRSSTGEDWPSMLGRLNAAMNQTVNIDQSIEDVTNHLVYEPKKSTTNPQDIPFFLSVRLVDENNANDNDGGNQDQGHDQEGDGEGDGDGEGNATLQMDGDESSVVINPSELLTRYEKNAADLANEFVENIVRFE